MKNDTVREFLVSMTTMVVDFYVNYSAVLAMLWFWVAVILGVMLFRKNRQNP